jgi:hypothetical protein
MKSAMAKAAASVDWLLALRRTSVTSSRLEDWVKADAVSNLVEITFGPTDPNT